MPKIKLRHQKNSKLKQRLGQGQRSEMAIERCDTIQHEQLFLFHSVAAFNSGISGLV